MDLYTYACILRNKHQLPIYLQHIFIWQDVHNITFSQKKICLKEKHFVECKIQNFKNMCPILDNRYCKTRQVVFLRWDLFLATETESSTYFILVTIYLYCQPHAERLSLDSSLCSLLFCSFLTFNFVGLYGIYFLNKKTNFFNTSLLLAWTASLDCNYARSSISFRG